MKFFVGLLISAFLGGAVSAAGAEIPELVIYTYDSFTAKGGLGREILPLFEKKCGCRVKALPCGDGVQILTRLQLDAKRGKPGAQIALGVDQFLWARAKPWAESWGDWVPAAYSRILPEAVIEKGVLPFDYGVLSFMADRKRFSNAKPLLPLEDLLSAALQKRFILENPKTSTPGLAFLAFTAAVMGEKVWDFWRRLKTQWLAMLPGWDGAYGLFLRGEAPLVWSYTSSQAYHRENGDAEGRYSALLLQEGSPQQIEGAFIVKDSVKDPEQRALARLFLEFLLSDEVQTRIPLKNWMFPSVSGVKLPASFKTLPAPSRVVRLVPSAQEVDQLLLRFSQAVEGGR